MERILNRLTAGIKMFRSNINLVIPDNSSVFCSCSEKESKIFERRTEGLL